MAVVVVVVVEMVKQLKIKVNKYNFKKAWESLTTKEI